MDVLKDKKVLVLGLGISGQSAIRFLLKRGALVFAFDDDANKLNTERVAALKDAGLSILEDLNFWMNQEALDLVIASPGIPTSHPCYQEAVKREIEIIGEVELACRAIKHSCVAITGTNGKTTVTLLVTHILNHAGKKAWALGNIGKPLTEAIDEIGETESDGVFVLELSSFQLETLKSVFVDVGMILNITPDHLDRYDSLESYAQAKIRLGRNIKPTGTFFVHQTCQLPFKNLLEAYHPRYYGCNSDCMLHTDKYCVWVEGQVTFDVPHSIRGKESVDLDNMLAAYALCRELGVSEKQFVEGFESFEKPPHRIQFIKNVGGMNFYDDSKGTNIDAVIKAVERMPGDVILIAGGVDKGFPYTSWIKAFDGKVKLICAIGEAAQKIKNDLDSDICVRIFSSMEHAVQYAAKSALANGNVLLSPGCSSYDMFNDYAHRGHEFQRIVHTL